MTAAVWMMLLLTMDYHHLLLLRRRRPLSHSRQPQSHRFLLWKDSHHGVVVQNSSMRRSCCSSSSSSSSCCSNRRRHGGGTTATGFAVSFVKILSSTRCHHGTKNRVCSSNLFHTKKEDHDIDDGDDDDMDNKAHEPKNNICDSTVDDVDDDGTKIEETTIQKKRIIMNPFRLAVLKLGMTELKWTSPLNYESREGQYSCADCGTILFDSQGKYDSGSGWPSFWRTVGGADCRILYKKEWDGRIECKCGTCKGHLGHVFPDGPFVMKRMTRTVIKYNNNVAKEIDLQSIPQDDLKVVVGSGGNSTGSKEHVSRLPRYCINGAALEFVPTTTATSTTMDIYRS